MRNVFHALPLTLVFLAACATAPEPRLDEDAQSAPEASVAAAPLAEPAPAATAQGQELQQDAERYTLAEQRKMFLVEEHLANARRLRDQLRFDEAQREAEGALDLAPESLEAKRLLSEILTLKGEPAGDLQTVTDELAERYALRVRKLKADVEAGLREGKLLLARGEYEQAIRELTIAQTNIRWAPYSIEWEGLDEEVAALLGRARSEREAAAEASRLAQERAAYEQLQAQAQAERDRREALVTNMLEQAIDAFEAADYDEAMEFAEQALRQDPRNEQAHEIRDAAFRAGREKVHSDYVQTKREQFRRWREEMEELQIPWTDVITLPDQERWAEITEQRSKRRGLDLSLKVSPSERELRARLASTTVQLPGIEEEESLETVVDIIRTITGLPLVVDPAAEEAVTDEGVVFNFSLENRVTVEQALNLITDMAGEQVAWTVRHDAVLITTREKKRGAPVIVNHDVQDLIFGLTDFYGPRIDRIRLLDELEDEDGGGPFGHVGERPRLIEPDDLLTLIQENVAVDTWEDDGVSIDAGEGFLLIVHEPDVQEQVRQFLQDLRRFSSSLVTIDSKFMSVGSNWLQEIGVDFRGLDDVEVTDVTNGLIDMASRGLDNNGTGTDGQNAAGRPAAGFFYDDGEDGDFRATTQNFFGNALGDALSNIGGLTFQLAFLNDLQLQAILRAVEKSEEFTLINDQVLSVHNTQHAYVTVINQQAYIQDFDVEVAQFQAVADPQINVLTDGVVLDVRPTIHHDRKYLTLEIQPTVAKVINIRNFSTTLGGNTSPVEFQLPELEVQSVFTTAIIPDGGSILLGGLSNVRNIERRAEVPWLANVPVVGFFFKQEGYSDENRSLMILIRARITDVREEVATIERPSATAAN